MYLKTKTGRQVKFATPEEDIAINRGIALDPDNPEWTTEDFKRARPAKEVFEQLGLSIPSSRGRPLSDNPKKQISLRLDADIVHALRASGKGWQTRLNEFLRHEMKLD